MKQQGHTILAELSTEAQKYFLKLITDIMDTKIGNHMSKRFVKESEFGGEDQKILDELTQKKILEWDRIPLITEKRITNVTLVSLKKPGEILMMWMIWGLALSGFVKTKTKKKCIR